MLGTNVSQINDEYKIILEMDTVLSWRKAKKKKDSGHDFFGIQSTKHSEIIIKLLKCWSDEKCLTLTKNQI